MGKKLWFVGLLALLAGNLAFAGVVPDSAWIPKQRKARFVFNFDARYTLFDKERVRVSGLKTGIEWKGKFRTGLGYYFLSSPIITSIPGATVDDPATEAHVKFSYGAVYSEYVILNNYRWELSVPLQGGYGKLQNERRSLNGQLLRTETQPLWLLEPSVAAHYKVFNWVGVGAGFGYRQMLNRQYPEARHLNAPVYYIKAKLFVGALYRQLRSHYCPAPPQN